MGGLHGRGHLLPAVCRSTTLRLELARLAVAVLLCTLMSQAVAETEPPSARVRQFDFVEDGALSVVSSSPRTTARTHPGTPVQTRAPQSDTYSEQVRVKFSASGEDIDVVMTPHRELFTAEHRMNVYDGQDRLIASTPPLEIAYAGRASHGGWARVTLMDDGTFHGTFKTSDNDILVVDPVSAHVDSLSVEARDVIPAHVRMVAYRLSEVLDSAGENRTCASRTAAPGTTPNGATRGDNDLALDNEGPGEPMKPRDVGATALDFLMERVPGGRRLASLSPLCPSSPKGLVVGIAVDCGFYFRVGSDAAVQQHMIAAANSAFAVYADQMNVIMKIGPTKIMSSCGGPAWNVRPQAAQGGDCPTPGDDDGALLNSFKSWQACCSNTDGTARDSSAGTWHLFTDCFPAPGVIGLSWVGGVCSTSGYNTAFTSWQPIASFWRTFAHEMGHNLGGQHQSSGIMTPFVDLTSTDFSSPSLVEICARITTGSPINCFTANPTLPTAQCGNGVREGSEVCDDASSCCNQTTCTLVAGAECSVSSSVWADACCQSCFFLPTSTQCSNQLGYCANGQCVFSSCDPSLWTGSSAVNVSGYCSQEAARPCLETCTRPGLTGCFDFTQVPSWYGWTFDGHNLAFTAPTGSLCRRFPPAYCATNGNCVAKAGFTVPTCARPTNLPANIVVDTANCPNTGSPISHSTCRVTCAGNDSLSTFGICQSIGNTMSVAYNFSTPLDCPLTCSVPSGADLAGMSSLGGHVVVNASACEAFGRVDVSECQIVCASGYAATGSQAPVTGTCKSAGANIAAYQFATQPNLGCSAITTTGGGTTTTTASTSKSGTTSSTTSPSTSSTTSLTTPSTTSPTTTASTAAGTTSTTTTASGASGPAAIVGNTGAKEGTGAGASVGAAVGGAVGGLVALGLVAALAMIVFVRRRRARAQGQTSGPKELSGSESGNPMPSDFDSSSDVSTHVETTYPGGTGLSPQPADTDSEAESAAESSTTSQNTRDPTASLHEGSVERGSASGETV